MTYQKTILLKDGRTCILRNGTAEDGKAVLDIFSWSWMWQLKTGALSHSTRAKVSLNTDVIQKASAPAIAVGRSLSSCVWNYKRHYAER